MNTLIIGAAGGIGSNLVEGLMGTSNLLLGYFNSSLSVPVESHQVNATDFQSVHLFVEKGLEKYGSVDAIVCLPGSLILKPAHRCSDEEFENTINTNLKSSFSVVRAAGALLENSSIVLMSTAAASIGLSNHELIVSAKAGVEGLARSAAKTYARKNLRFNTISPGMVETPLTSSITSNEIVRKASEKMHVLQRIGKPRDISNMIKFLINPENDWITGQNFIVDGGLSSTK
ncbi:MAG: SDR family NAD(P)-dependent oxidoreductase [Candidatus Neomarinimicrobiota bacterium]|nr:2-deoxy-D-gluconate 3-dehydrogenase [Candidatus Neomarinimicrobiota bacterium]|tara:strand:+ start:768 stop:1460 length:693 start_codon:yes stop_codon:yes gene_type:complete